MLHIKEPSFWGFSLLPRFYYVSQVIAVIHSSLSLSLSRFHTLFYGIFRLNKSSTCLAWRLRKFSKKKKEKEECCEWEMLSRRVAAVERKVNGSNEKGQTSILQTILKSEEQQTSSSSTHMSDWEWDGEWSNWREFSK